MTDDELVRKTALLNCEIIITHGLTEGGVGFEWHGLFIHDPFADPQYGAFPVDPVQQYGDAYTGSIFVSRANSLPRVDARSGTRKTPAGLSIRRAQRLKGTPVHSIGPCAAEHGIELQLRQNQQPVGRPGMTMWRGGSKGMGPRVPPVVR